MARFLVLLFFVLAFIVLIGNLIHLRVKRILAENELPVKSYFLRFMNAINFNRHIKGMEEGGLKNRYRNLLTLDVFVQILVIILLIAFFLILVNDFYRQ